MPLNTEDTAATGNGQPRGMYLSLVVMFAAHLANSVISLVRMKIFALLMGPAGIGILALFQNVQSTATTLAGIGLATSGVRELAGEKSDKAVFSRVRQTLFLGLFIQGCIAMLAVWLLRDAIAAFVFNDAAHGFEVGLLGIVILLTMIGTSQVTLLQGLRKVKDIGKIMAFSALVSTLVGIAVVWWIGDSGIVWFLLAQAVVGIVVARYFTRKLEGTVQSGTVLKLFFQSWCKMAKIGFPFMLGALVSTGSLLVVRGGIADWQGMDAAGYFAASWAISLLYVNFILQALNTDFYPRLSEIGDDTQKTAELVNTQILVSMSIGGPIVLFTIFLAPWLVSLLYTTSFAPTAELLQWQGFGNVLKLVALPLSYVLVARGHSVIFFLMEIVWNGLFIAMIFGGIGTFGLVVVGVSYFIAYFVFLVLHIVHLKAKFDLTLNRDASLITVMFFSMAALVLFLSQNLGGIGVVLCLGLSILTSAMGLRIVFTSMVKSNTPVPARIQKIFSFLGMPLQKNSEPQQEPD